MSGLHGRENRGPAGSGLARKISWTGRAGKVGTCRVYYRHGVAGLDGRGLDGTGDEGTRVAWRGRAGTDVDRNAAARWGLAGLVATGRARTGEERRGGNGKARLVAVAISSGVARHGGSGLLWLGLESDGKAWRDRMQRRSGDWRDWYVPDRTRVAWRCTVRTGGTGLDRRGEARTGQERNG